MLGFQNMVFLIALPLALFFLTPKQAFTFFLMILAATLAMYIYQSNHPLEILL